LGGDYLVELTFRAIVYAVRAFQRQRKLKAASNWLPVTGLVRSVTRERGVVDVLMTYQFEGGYFCDYHKRDLFFEGSAKEYAARFPSESSCVIRVDPSRPEQIAVFDEDQLKAVQVATVS
jgi:hypothetical protein